MSIIINPKLENSISEFNENILSKIKLDFKLDSSIYSDIQINDKYYFYIFDYDKNYRDNIKNNSKTESLDYNISIENLINERVDQNISNEFKKVIIILRLSNLLSSDFNSTTISNQIEKVNEYIRNDLNEDTPNKINITNNSQSSFEYKNLIYNLNIYSLKYKSLLLIAHKDIDIVNYIESAYYIDKDQRVITKNYSKSNNINKVLISDNCCYYDFLQCVKFNKNTINDIINNHSSLNDIALNYSVDDQLSKILNYDF